VPRSSQNGYIDWDEGREGYVRSQDKFVPVVDVPKGKRPKSDSSLLSVRGQERLGSLIAAGGMVWGVYVATVDYNSLWHLNIMQPGPVEVCLLGILAWLHAKWRRSLKSG
jgi:hypothetical protein